MEIPSLAVLRRRLFQLTWRILFKSVGLGGTSIATKWANGKQSTPTWACAIRSFSVSSIVIDLSSIHRRQENM